MLASGCGDSPGPSYVALGDSYTVGTGSSDPKTLGYAAGFHHWLQENNDDRVELHNFAVNGETTTSMMQEGQLRRAIAFIRARNSDGDPSNDVRVISISIGGNDVREPIRKGGPCASARLTEKACVDAIGASIATFDKNFPVILREVRQAAGPSAILLVATYNNPYSGSGDPLDVETTNAVLREFNKRIETGAADSQIRGAIVDFFPPFIGKSRDLTGLTTPQKDFHPNNAGHHIMSEVIIDAFQHANRTGEIGGGRR